MHKINKNESGFSAVEVILVIVIVALIGVVGWLVYKDHLKTSSVSTTNTSSNKTTTTNLATTSSSKPATSTKTTITQTTNLYTWWQSMCSSYGGLCLKYPSIWKLSTTTNPSPNQSGDYYVITSPNSTNTAEYPPEDSVEYQTNTEYTNGWNNTTGVYTTKILSVSSPAGTSDFKVVEALVTEYQSWLPHPYSYYLDFFVTTNSEVQQQGIVQGNTLNNPSSAISDWFTNPKSSNPQANQMISVSPPAFSSLADAQNWLNTSDGKTAGLILSSLSYSN